MSTPLGLIAHGSFTSTGAKKLIGLPKKPNHFIVTNVTRWGSSSNAVIQSFWYDSMADGQAKLISESGAGAMSSGRALTGTNGFRFYDLSAQTPGAAVAVAGISQANPALLTTATTPSAGDIVRVYGTTGMLQVAGLDFTVGTVVSGVSFELANLDSSGFAAAATAGFYRVIPSVYYQPSVRTITSITAALNAVITFSVDHGYEIGDKLRIKVPVEFGMIQMDNRVVTVTAKTASTITVDVDSSAFTAFAFPTSAVAAAGLTFAQAIPVGEISSSLLSPVGNDAYYAMEIGTASVGAAGQTIHWMAYSADYNG